MEMIFVYVILGLMIGSLIGLTGVGGGVLTVPSLIFIVGLDPISAVGTASLFACLTRIYATYRHYRQHTINWQAGFKFFAIALPGVVGSALLVKYLESSLPSDGVETLQNVVSYLIVFSIAFSLLALSFDHTAIASRMLASSHGRALAVFGVFLIGAIMGATSIGGGILIIPALLIIFQEKTKYVGTSILVSMLIMFVMAAIYAFVGRDGDTGAVNVEVAAYMVLGSFAGTHYGSLLSKRIEPKRLKGLVIAVIIIAIVMMLLEKFAG